MLKWDSVIWKQQNNPKKTSKFQSLNMKCTIDMNTFEGIKIVCLWERISNVMIPLAVWKNDRFMMIASIKHYRQWFWAEIPEKEKNGVYY